MEINERVFVATREKAAAISGMSPARLDYWASTALVRPSVDERLTPHRPIRMYSYMELLAVLIVAEMRRRDISLQHIRTVVERVRGRGYDNPLTEVRYAVVGRRLYLQDEDGRWEDGDHPGQLVVPNVLDLEPLRHQILRSSARPRSASGVIEKRRQTLGFQPVLSGTRIPVATVRRYIDAGQTNDQIVAEYPLLTRDDVEAVRALAG